MLQQTPAKVSNSLALLEFFFDVLVRICLGNIPLVKSVSSNIRSLSGRSVFGLSIIPFSMLDHFLVVKNLLLFKLYSLPFE